MSNVPFTGTGSLGTRLGHIFGAINDINNFRDGAVFAGTNASTATGAPNVTSLLSIDNRYKRIMTDFNNNNTDSNLIDGLFTAKESYKAVHQSLLSYLQTLAVNTVIQMSNDSVSLPTKTLQAALNQIISQMSVESSSGAYISGNTVTVNAASANSNNTGTGNWIGTKVLNIGVNAEYVYDETLTLTFTSDASRGSTRYQEPFTIKGQAAAASLLAQDWPKGSGCSVTGNAVNFLQNMGSSSGNILNNGSMQNGSGSTLTGWTPTLGTDTLSQVTSSPSPYFTGQSNHTKITSGNSSGTAASFVQTFSASTVSTGTSFQILPSTAYAVGVWYYCSNNEGVGSALQAFLVDGNGTPLKDGAGNTCEPINTFLGNNASTWVFTSGFVNTPTVLPTPTAFKIGLTNVLTSGHSIVIMVAMTQALQLYPSGPYTSFFSAATPMAIGDSYTMVVQNPSGGVFQRSFWQVFGVPGLGLTPAEANGKFCGAPFTVSSGTSTARLPIADSLVQ